MKVLLICAALVTCACARGDTDVESVKSVKGGGHSNYQYKGGDTSRFYNNFTQPGYGGHHNGPAISEVGVCYIEVPTASLVRDPAHVPAGNGSRPDLSRIRTCCQGYKRNIYNFLLCEPVCTKECVNGLCSAPETCSCFPDHVKNLAGFCVATCPIGCQNGHCAGGECLCKEGFKLDINGRFCVPSCRANCGGLGNCTAPNTCECKPGYKSTPDGSCRPAGGACTGPSCDRPGLGQTLQCPRGYVLNLQSSMCEPVCSPECGSNGRCVSPNVCSPYATVNVVAPFPGPQQPSYGPHQTNTSYYNPNQNSQYPYPYNQNTSPGYPQTTSRPGQPTNQETMYSMYPNGTLYPLQPNQFGPQYPHHQGSQRPNTTYPNFNPQYPTHVTHNVTYPNPPLYPGNQVGPQYPNQNGNYSTQHNQNLYPSLPNNDNSYVRPGNYPSQVEVIPYGQQQGQFPQYPYQFGSNSTYPGQTGQYPQYPLNQFGSNSTHPDQQGQHPQYPSNQFGINSTNPKQPGGNYPQQPLNQNSASTTSPNQQGHNPQYPYQYGTNTYPGQPGHYPQNPSNQYGNTTYPNQQGGYNPNYPSNPSQPNQGFNPYGVPGSTDPDYQQANTFSLCSQPCVNGVCIDFNRCRCNPGYVQDENDPSGNRCKPHCPGGCPNGYCAAPYSCACDEGYHKDTSVKGRAICVKRI